MQESIFDLNEDVNQESLLIYILNKLASDSFNFSSELKLKLASS